VAPATGMTPLIDELVEHGHEFSLVQVMRLGDPSSRLGLNMWCFSGDTLGKMSAVFRMAALPEI
jgi:hypothetical protein